MGGWGELSMGMETQNKNMNTVYEIGIQNQKLGIPLKVCGTSAKFRQYKRLWCGLN